MWTTGQGVVIGVKLYGRIRIDKSTNKTIFFVAYLTYQKRIRAVATGDTAHAGHGGHRRCHWAGSQIDNALAIGSWTSDALR